MTGDVLSEAESLDEYRDVYDNAVTGATPNPLMRGPDDIDERFAIDANRAPSDAVELLRRLIPSHQSAAAIIVQDDLVVHAQVLLAFSEVRGVVALPSGRRRSRHSPMAD